jgi:hypothetical protein
MAGNDDRQRIGRAGSADRSNGAWIADPFGDLLIGLGPAVRDLREVALNEQGLVRIAIGRRTTAACWPSLPPSSGQARSAARNVSDQASSASGPGPSAARQTRNTVAPCCSTARWNGSFMFITL